MNIEISEDGFINALRAINGGAAVEELDREIMKGVQAVRDHGGKSTVTLKLTLGEIKGLEAGINLEHDITGKHPKEKRPDKVMFASKGNGLVDQPQSQERLPLERVEGDKPARLSRIDGGAA